MLTNTDTDLAAAANARRAAYRRHWRINLLMTATTLSLSAAASFLPPLWARQLAAIRLAGMPLPFYMGAQGAVLLYVCLVALYAIAMGLADRALKQRLADLPVLPEAPSPLSPLPPFEARAHRPNDPSSRDFPR